MGDNIIKPVKLCFFAEEHYTHDDITYLWEATNICEDALDKFWAGEIDDFELTDYFDYYGVDEEEIADIVEENLYYMYGIKT